jgi:hypothetical protein
VNAASRRAAITMYRPPLELARAAHFNLLRIFWLPSVSFRQAGRPENPGFLVDRA